MWERLPQESLPVLERYYGQAPMLGQLQTRCEPRSSHFLVRVRDKLNVQVQQPHADGSATVAVTLRKPASAAEPADGPPAKTERARGRPRKHPALKVSELKVREVCGRVLRSSEGKWVEVRLWTSLSPQQASAEQLLELYARRWGQEIFYKELNCRSTRVTCLADNAWRQQQSRSRAHQLQLVPGIHGRAVHGAAKPRRGSWTRRLAPTSLPSSKLFAVSPIA